LATQTLTFQPIKANFVYEVLRNYLKIIEKRFVVSFCTFYKFLGNQGELERTETTKNFCWCRSIFLK